MPSAHAESESHVAVSKSIATNLSGRWAWPPGSREATIVTLLEILEAPELRLPEKPHGVGRSVALRRDDELRDPRVSIPVEEAVAVEEADGVGVVVAERQLRQLRA